MNEYPNPIIAGSLQAYGLRDKEFKKHFWKFGHCSRSRILFVHVSLINNVEVLKCIVYISLCWFESCDPKLWQLFVVSHQAHAESSSSSLRHVSQELFLWEHQSSETEKWRIVLYRDEKRLFRLPGRDCEDTHKKQTVTQYKQRIR
jgi:hypothetical protein